MTKDPNKLLQNNGPWYYEMHELGYNYRITDFQMCTWFKPIGKVRRFCSKKGGNSIKIR